jgi:hypothetical protein
MIAGVPANPRRPISCCFLIAIPPAMLLPLPSPSMYLNVLYDAYCKPQILDRGDLSNATKP